MKQRRANPNRARASIFVCKSTKRIIFSLTMSVVEELSPEQEEMQQLARKFAKEEIIPQAAHFDKTGEVENRNLLKKSEIFPIEYLFKQMNFEISSLT